MLFCPNSTKWRHPKSHTLKSYGSCPSDDEVKLMIIWYYKPSEFEDGPGIYSSVFETSTRKLLISISQAKRVDLRMIPSSWPLLVLCVFMCHYWFCFRKNQKFIITCGNMVVRMVFKVCKEDDDQEKKIFEIYKRI